MIQKNKSGTQGYSEYYLELSQHYLCEHEAEECERLSSKVLECR